MHFMSAVPRPYMRPSMICATERFDPRFPVVRNLGDVEMAEQQHRLGAAGAGGGGGQSGDDVAASFSLARISDVDAVLCQFLLISRPPGSSGRGIDAHQLLQELNRLRLERSASVSRDQRRGHDGFPLDGRFHGSIMLA